MVLFLGFCLANEAYLVYRLGTLDIAVAILYLCLARLLPRLHKVLYLAAIRTDFHLLIVPAKGRLLQVVRLRKPVVTAC